MKSKWYCTDCETTIESDEVEAHEDEDHHVRGQLRPDRLVSQDPWNVGDEALAEEDGE